MAMPTYLPGSGVGYGEGNGVGLGLGANVGGGVGAAYDAAVGVGAYDQSTCFSLQSRVFPHLVLHVGHVLVILGSLLT